ncbi:MAG TPA: DUF3043 domain-containing protein [Actinomycetes bacterium]|nr:DUF3043 domain-containing protein [Actinomycetes bacterium]
MLFRRSPIASSPESDAASNAEQAGAEDQKQGKGRPTPKRREAEAARKQKAAPPKDKREARARLKAERAKERQEAVEAMRSGDERRYPPRDQGKARHIARNWIDGRRNVGEVFWPVVITALVLLFMPVPALQQLSTIVLLGFYIVITVDSGLSLLGLRRALNREIPEQGQRRGALAYAFGRSLQSRKRRMPVPKVERGWTRKYVKGEVPATVA